MQQPPDPESPWRTVLQLVRAPAILVAISNILAAHLLATGGAIQWRGLVLLCGAGVFLFAAGNVLDECFDRAADLHETSRHPRRSSLQAAWANGWFLLAGGVALAGLAGHTQMFIAGLIAVGIVAYHGLGKHTRFGPYVMAACHYSTWLLGLSVVPLTTQSLLIALPIFVYGASAMLLGPGQPVTLDGIALNRCAAGLLLTALAVAALILNGILQGLLALVPLAGGLVFLLQRLTNTARAPSPEKIRSTAQMLILGLIPLDALLVLAAGSTWGMLAVLTLLLPAHALARVK